VIDVEKPPFGATRAQVFVRDNDVEQALRILKRKIAAGASMKSPRTRLRERKRKLFAAATSVCASRPFETD
jgi:ribosomal protein S21